MKKDVKKSLGYETRDKLHKAQAELHDAENRESKARSHDYLSKRNLRAYEKYPDIYFERLTEKERKDTMEWLRELDVKSTQELNKARAALWVKEKEVDKLLDKYSKTPLGKIEKWQTAAREGEVKTEIKKSINRTLKKIGNVKIKDLFGKKKR